MVSAGILALSCKKKAKSQNPAQNPVPYVQVDITMYPNDPLNLRIQGIGGWMYINGGLNGIVLYRKSEEEFVAIERTSSELPDNPAARVVVLNDNFTLRDTISGSEWRIIDAAVKKGPAEWPLRIYGSTYNGNSLRIKN
jgi:hypothetical protein